MTACMHRHCSAAYNRDLRRPLAAEDSFCSGLALLAWGSLSARFTMPKRSFIRHLAPRTPIGA
jgi:hypothetical protein